MNRDILRRLTWALELAPNLLLIPGSPSRLHRAENVAAQHIAPDEQPRRELSAPV
jgi:pyridoxine 4-dehydrogenase